MNNLRTPFSWLAGVVISATAVFPVFATELPAQNVAQSLTDTERGRYLAIAGDCVACHTAPGGKPMAGGLALQSPLGAIYSTNITPSKTHGIGNYTLEQFSDALRHGKRADGANLYPAMPYTAYAKTTDEDIKALYAYFLQDVAAIDEAAPQTDLPFPFNIRMSMSVWNAIFNDAAPYQQDATQTPEWNRGAYLAQGLAHCTTCHTPRNFLMAENQNKYLAGAEVSGWYAPNITSDPVSGIGNWTIQELTDYMSSKPVIGKGNASGPMAEAIDHSLKHLTAEDLQAIAVYIKSVPAISDKSVKQSAASFGQPVDNLDTVRGVPLPANSDTMSGAQIYDAYCATCHQAQGQGSDAGGLPSLFHNTTLGYMNTNNLVLVTLNGVHRVGVDTVMPGFAHELSDKQIVTLSNYLLKNYGNPDAKVSEEQVTKLRDPATANNDNTLLILVRSAMAGGLIVVLVICIWFYRRRNKQQSAS